MTHRDAQLDQALDQQRRLYGVVARLRDQHLPHNPARFALMAEGYLDEIRNLREQIEELSGAAEAIEREADVWLRIEGRGVEWPGAPTSILTSMIDALRKGVQAVGELLTTGDLGSRPTAELKSAFDLRVAALRSGSLRVGLELPAPDGQAALFETPIRSVAEEALETYLQVAGWIASDAASEALEEKFPDAQRRRAYLNAVKPLVPRPRGKVTLVELSGVARELPRRIRLEKGSSLRIDNAIDRLVKERTETHEGDLREIDLDEHKFILRNAGEVQQLPCSFPPDLTEAAKEALDRRVRVTGVREIVTGRRAAKPLAVTRFEIVDEADVDTAAETTS